MAFNRRARALGGVLAFWYALGVAAAGDHRIEPTPAQLEEFAKEHDRRIEQCKQKIDEATKTLNDIRAARVPFAERRQARVAAQAKLDFNQKLLKDLEAGAMRYDAWPLFVGKVVPDVGVYGRLDNRKISVLQVVDVDRALVTLDKPDLVVMLRIPTADLIDNVLLSIDGTRQFIVAGTYQYTSVGGGTRTVLSLSELNMEAVRKFLADRAAKGVRP